MTVWLPSTCARTKPVTGKCTCAVTCTVAERPSGPTVVWSTCQPSMRELGNWAAKEPRAAASAPTGSSSAPSPP